MHSAYCSLLANCLEWRVLAQTSQQMFATSVRSHEAVVCLRLHRHSVSVDSAAGAFPWNDIRCSDIHWSDILWSDFVASSLGTFVTPHRNETAVSGCIVTVTAHVLSRITLNKLSLAVSSLSLPTFCHASP